MGKCGCASRPGCRIPLMIKKPLCLTTSHIKKTNRLWLKVPKTLSKEYCREWTSKEKNKIGPIGLSKERRSNRDCFIRPQKGWGQNFQSWQKRASQKFHKHIFKRSASSVKKNYSRRARYHPRRKKKIVKIWKPIRQADSDAPESEKELQEMQELTQKKKKEKRKRWEQHRLMPFKKNKVPILKERQNCVNWSN